MKTERINIRTDEDTKLQLLLKAKQYNMTLSDFILNVTLRETKLDCVQIWVDAYCRCVIKRKDKVNNNVMERYKFEDCDDTALSVPIFENTYTSRFDFLEELQYAVDYDLPNMFEVLDRWDEFTQRLELLGLYKDEVKDE